jgi:hypothetical protein
VAGVESRDFDSPDETRTPDKTQVAVVRMGVTTAARMTFEPGWRWSECVGAGVFWRMRSRVLRAFHEGPGGPFARAVAL